MGDSLIILLLATVVIIFIIIISRLNHELDSQKQKEREKAYQELQQKKAQLEAEIDNQLQAIGEKRPDKIEAGAGVYGKFKANDTCTQQNFSVDCWYSEAKDALIAIADTYNGKRPPVLVFCIPRKDILYYVYSYETHYVTEVANKGKNISLGGAVAGGLIAGEAGAIIGSRKDANKIQSKITKVNNASTNLYVKYDGQIINYFCYGESGLITLLNTHFPEKNKEMIDTMSNAKSQPSSENMETELQSDSSIEYKLEQLQSLLDKSLITQEEYAQQKQRILNSL